MKVYLDDVREAPDGWMCVRRTDEAIELLMSGQVTHLSLDSDDVFNWIDQVVAVDHDFVLPEITIHSDDPLARVRMQAELDEIRVIYDMGKDIQAAIAAAIWRASAENRRTLQVQYMQPKLAEILDELKAIILANYGDCIDRIVIIGSAVGPGFRAGPSDVDLVLMMNETPSPLSWKDSTDFKEKVNAAFPGPWSKIDITEKSSKQVHRIGTNFSASYEGSVLRGFIVYDKNPAESYEILGKEEAQRHVVESYMSQAWHWLRLASGTNGDCAWSVCRSVCRVLHAVLCSHDLNFSSKSLRWNIVELCEVAETLSPGLHVKKLVSLLPPDLAFIDFDEVKPDDGLTIRERRRLIAIGVMAVRHCERNLGLRADHRKKSLLKEIRSFEKEMMAIEDVERGML